MAETRAETIASCAADPNGTAIDGSTSAASGADRAVATGEVTDPEKGGTPVAGGPTQKAAVAASEEQSKQLQALVKDSQKAQRDAMKAVESTSKELASVTEERDALQARLNELEGELASARAEAPFGAPEQGTISVNHKGEVVA
jgi:prophage DNA circulation protein